jgi:hypothetical protein
MAKDTENAALQLKLFGEENFVSKLHQSAFLVKNVHPLVRAKVKFESLIARRIYTEVLAQDHLKEKDRLNYVIDYSLFSDIKDENKRKNRTKIQSFIYEALNADPIRLTPEDYKQLGEFNQVGTSVFAPFTKINYRLNELTVFLNEDFKKILIAKSLDYLGGELSLLRSLESEPSHLLYWEIREAQRAGKNKMSFKLGDLRKLLRLDYVKDKKEIRKNIRFDHFKSRVLDKIKEEFLNKWVEFDYRLIKGAKGAVVEVEFTFIPDKELENELKRNLSQDWQKELYTRYEFPIGKIQIITNHIHKQRQIIDGKDLVWSNQYVAQTIRLCQVRFYQVHQGKPNVPNEAGYIFDALFEGTFIDMIDGIIKRQIIRALPQLGLKEKPVKKEKKRTGEPFLISEARQFLYDKNFKISFEEWYTRQGYIAEGEFLVKYE